MLSKNKQIITAFALLLAYFTCLFYYYNSFMVKKSRETQMHRNVLNSYIEYEEKTNETCRSNNYNKTAKGWLGVLCAIFTTKQSHQTRMKAIHDTWSKRCDIRIYMTGPKSRPWFWQNDNNDDPSMPFVYMNIEDTKEKLTYKHLGTIMHVYKNYMNDFDWFLYANDDAFIVMDNLKLFLKDKCPKEKRLYGKVMRHLPNEPNYNYGDWKRYFQF